MKSKIVIKFPNRLVIGLLVIVISSVFFIKGWEAGEISKIFDEHFELQEKFVPNNEVHFDDPDPRVGWMKEFTIDKTDDDPLDVGKSLGFHGYIYTKELPEDIVLHIFHEDMSDYFTGTQDYDYRDIANELHRVPALKYSDMFSIRFDLTEFYNNEPRDHYDLNGFESMTFEKPGTYFAQVSVKTKSGEIDHYKSSSSVLTIRDPLEEWTVETMESLINEAEKQRVDTISTFGLAYIGIGIGIFFAGINIVFYYLEKKDLLRLPY